MHNGKTQVAAVGRFASSNALDSCNSKTNKTNTLNLKQQEQSTSNSSASVNNSNNNIAKKAISVSSRFTSSSKSNSYGINNTNSNLIGNNHYRANTEINHDESLNTIDLSNLSTIRSVASTPISYESVDEKTIINNRENSNILTKTKYDSVIGSLLPKRASQVNASNSSVNNSHIKQQTVYQLKAMEICDDNLNKSKIGNNSNNEANNSERNLMRNLEVYA
jgi:hypothetical protein